MKHRGVTLAVSVVLALAGCLSTAQAQSGAKNRLVGTWNVTVTRAGAPPGQPLSFPVVYSFLANGVMLETGGASLYRTPGHGVWDYDGSRHYSAEFMFFRFSPDGQYIGTQHVTLGVDLTQGDDAFTGTIVFEIIDLAGNVIATANATAEAQRMRLTPQ